MRPGHPGAAAVVSFAVLAAAGCAASTPADTTASGVGAGGSAAADAHADGAGAGAGQAGAGGSAGASGWPGGGAAGASEAGEASGGVAGDSGADAIAPCTPGDSKTGKACGNCGTEKQVCDPSGQWGPVECTGQGACAASAEDYECCPPGQSGKWRKRLCSGSCQWGGWGACEQETVAPATSPGPQSGATGASTKPDFTWSLPTPGMHGFYTNLYLWDCSAANDACWIGWGGKGDAWKPVTSLPFASLQKVVNKQVGGALPQLACQKQYFWTVTPGTSCFNVVAQGNPVWTFTTGCP